MVFLQFHISIKQAQKTNPVGGGCLFAQTAEEKHGEHHNHLGGGPSSFCQGVLKARNMWTHTSRGLQVAR